MHRKSYDIYKIQPLEPTNKLCKSQDTKLTWKSIMFIYIYIYALNCGVGEDSWESLGLQGDPTSPF